MNTFGKYFTVTTFGESHGPAIGGVIDGIPSGVAFDRELLDEAMKRRRPGKGIAAESARKESDEVEILSGVFEGFTLGTPIGFIIRNTDSRSADYEELKNISRPSHADRAYLEKYGIRDYRGGGRASARETACRVVAGAFARMALKSRGVEVKATVERVGSCTGSQEELLDEAARYASFGDSIGGVVKCEITGLPAGLGEPVYDKFQAWLASAMMSIPAAKGFEYGIGFEGVSVPGSMQNDLYIKDPESGDVVPMTNNSGGIQGGITNGQPVVFNVAFKPAASIRMPQPIVDDSGNPVVLKIRGRHDACVAFRAVPVVEAMAWITILDMTLADRARRDFPISEA